jgi:rare lipoprotein A
MRYSITIPRLAVAAAALLAVAGCKASPAPPGPAPAAAAGSAGTPDELVLTASGHAETGKATWYGRRHHGRRTASGEVFDRHGMTAAHARLPLGTRVRVTNPSTGQSVIVRINDRCRCPGIMIDLSEGAARSIGLLSTGRVRMERL